jgi:hypothetical protein
MPKKALRMKFYLASSGAGAGIAKGTTLEI